MPWLLLLLTPPFCSLYVQPPNVAGVDQRREALARQGIGERNVGGRVRRFEFAEPTDERPCKLADNLTNYGMFWQEWEYGIGGNKPAKLWTPEEIGSSSTFGRRRPIYLLLNRTINLHKRLPAEAFRLMEDHFGSKGFGKVAQEIRRREINGTMPSALRDDSNPLNIRRRHNSNSAEWNSRKRRRRS